MITAETYDRLVMVDVDVQKDFCQGGNLPGENADEVVGPLNELNDWTRQNDGTVVHTADDHPPETSHFGNPPDFDTTWPPHCVHGTEGAEFHDDLRVEPEDTIVLKGTKQDEAGYSGFDGHSEDGQTLESIISPRGDEKVAVIIGGLVIEECVKSTVFDGLELARRFNRAGLRVGVYVVTDAVRPINEQGGKVALGEMRAAGARLVTTAQILGGEVIRKAGE